MPALPLSLGPRSTTSMLLLWSQPDGLRDRAVYKRLTVENDLAYTTVTSILNYLTKQGMLDRRHNRDLHYYIYRPTCSAEAYVQRATAQLRAQFGLDANEHTVGAT